MTTHSRQSTLHHHSKRRPGQTLVEFALTLPILILLLFGIIEFGRIFQAWVTIQNAAREAIRYAVTGQYDVSMFNLDNNWDPSNLVAHPGIPCPYTNTDPQQGQFKNHWDGMACDPGNDDYYWMRRDVVRLYTIYQTARIGAAGLALNANPPDIPGTCQADSSGVCVPNTGFGVQTRTELLNKLRTERGWFHVWICSTRVTLNDTDSNGRPYARYSQGNEGADKAEADGTRFGQCRVNEGPASGIGANPNYGKDQYDPGGPGDFVQVTVYFNHPLITPLAFQSNGFITLRARRVAINESYRTAKLVNITDQGSGAGSVHPPKLEKTFASPSIPMNGGTTNLLLKVTNTNAVDALTTVAFTDTFPTATGGLPVILVNGAIPAPTGSCAGASITPQAGGVGVNVAIDNVPESSACTFTVPVIANPALPTSAAGPYVNKTSPISSVNGGAGSAASDSLILTASATITKTFMNVQTAVNTPNKMTLHITNDNAADLHNASFSDYFPTTPAGMKVATPPNWSISTGCGGILSGNAPDSTSLLWTNGTIPAHGACDISVDVVGTVANSTYNNMVSGVSTAEGGTGASSSASFTVLNVLVANKTFATGTTTVGQPVTLNFKITNPTTGATANGVNFTDMLPPSAPAGGALTVATPNGLMGLTGCGPSPNVSAVSGSGTITLANAVVASGTDCTFSVNVVASQNGTYSNSATVNSSNMGSVSMADTLVVLAKPTVTKSFGQTLIAPGGTAPMTITVSNSNSTALNDTTFTDTFPSGLVIAGSPAATTTCAGASLTASAGSGSVVLAPFALAANTTCTVNVTVTSSTRGVYNNTVTVNTSNAGSSTPASATLMVGSVPTIKIGYNTNQSDPSSVSNGDGSIPSGGSIPLTVVVTNPSTNVGVNLTWVNFTDVLSGNSTVTTSNPGTVAGGANNCGFAAPGLNGVTAFRFSKSVTLTPGQSCYVTVNYVTSGAVGTYSNSIPASTPGASAAGFEYIFTATSGGQTFGGNVASNSISLNVSPGISVSKQFNGNSSSWAIINDNATLTITLSNPNAFDVTGATFTDTLPNTLTVANPANAGTDCPWPSALQDQSGGSISPGDTAIKLVNGKINDNSSCNIWVDVAGSTIGDYTNTLGVNAVSSANGGKNATQAAATLHVLGGPNVTKSVGSGTISIGQPTTLSIKLINPNPTTQLSHVNFVDTFPNGLVVANPPNVSNGCGSGTVTDLYDNNVTAGDTGIKLSGGTINGGSNCTITVSVTANAVGSYTNTLTAQTYNLPGSPGQVTLNVIANPPSVTKGFNPTSINVNGASTLTLTLTNPNTNPKIDYTGLTVTDALPAGLSVANPANASSNCGGSLQDQSGGSVSTGDTTIKLVNGTLNAGSSATTCTITVSVTGSAAGVYANQTSGASATNTGTGNPSNTANLVVTGPATIAKSFNPSSITLGSTATLTITLSNSNSQTALTGVSFSDSFPTSPSQMKVASTPNFSSSGCGAASISGNTANSTSLAMSSGSIGAGGTCTIRVDVTGAVIGSYTNTAGAPTSSPGGTGVASAPQTLTITNPNPPGVNKSFNPTVMTEGQNSTLTLTLNNPGTNAVDLTGVGLTDTLPVGLKFSGSASTTCTGGSANTSGTTLTLTSASISPGQNCTVSVGVTNVAPVVIQTIYTNITGVVTASGPVALSGNTASASLMINPTVQPQAPVIDTSFEESPMLGTIPNYTFAGRTIKLVFHIQNPNAATMSGVAFSDNFPSGSDLKVANQSFFSALGCGSSVAGMPAAGAASISLSNIVIPANSTCTIQFYVISSHPDYSQANPGTAISYTNVTSAVTATAGNLTGNSASATIQIDTAGGSKGQD